MKNLLDRKSECSLMPELLTGSIMKFEKLKWVFGILKVKLLLLINRYIKFIDYIFVSEMKNFF